MASRLVNGWFTEHGSLWPGQGLSFEVDEVLLDTKSEFQDIAVYKTKAFGNVLVLDGAIQTTDRDWHAYQEMITHVAAIVHPNPEKVLIIGGGDGAVIGEVVKHKSVKEVILCELDEGVVTACKEFFPQFKWDDPRLKVLFADGAKYLAENPGTFDLVIVDSSDPVGPAETLYTKNFYQNLKQALRPGGMMVQQAESVWLHLDIIKKIFEDNKAVFPSVDYAYTTIPSYPSGQIGFILCSEAAGVNFRAPTRSFKDAIAEDATVRYYSEEIHPASFVLPKFAADVLHN